MVVLLALDTAMVEELGKSGVFLEQVYYHLNY